MSEIRISARRAAAILTCMLSGLLIQHPAGATPTPIEPLPTEYVISLSGVTPAAFRHEHDLTDARLLQHAVNGVVVDLTPEERDELAADPAVTAMTPSTVARGQAQLTPSPVTSVGGGTATDGIGDGTSTWSGPAVAVLDSGAPDHPDLAVAGSVDCTENKDGVADQNGHATLVSGRIAALDNDYGVVGVAPGAPLYSVRVLGAQNDGSTATVLCGLDWVAGHAAELGIKVVNLSLYLDGSDTPDCGRSANGTVVDPLHSAVCTLTDMGIVVVASAGNRHPGGKAFTDIVPATYPEVLTATAAVDYDGTDGSTADAPTRTPASKPTGCTNPSQTYPDDAPFPLSNYAATPEDRAHTIAAPAVCTISTLPGKRYGFAAPGSSMSAAVVSGVVLQCFAQGHCDASGTSRAAMDAVLADAAHSTDQHHHFKGDPFEPLDGRYYGNMASIVPARSALDFSGSSAPAVSGTAKVGGSLAATEPALIPTPMSVSISWLRSTSGTAGSPLTAMSGSTGPTLTIPRSAAGLEIVARATAASAGVRDAVGDSRRLRIPAVNVTRPTISGTAQVGRTVKANRGTWVGAGYSYRYAWYLDGRLVTGQRSSTYRLGTTSAKRTVTVKVTASKAGWATVTAVSRGVRVAGR